MSRLEKRLLFEAKMERKWEWTAPERIQTGTSSYGVAYLPTDKRPPNAEVRLMNYMREEAFA